jgi:hypothetical protein
MSKNAMAGAVTLCGVGLCTIGGALLMQNGQQAHAAASSMPAAAAAVAATANAQAGPTVVWYGVTSAAVSYSTGGLNNSGVTQFAIVARAWSDGRVEAKGLYAGPCGVDACNPSAGWQTVSTPTQGYRAAADINADELVDGVDLASVLGNWGDAPRVPFPASDCPLNLINP